MKVNLTKKHVEDLEKAVKVLKEASVNAKGQERKDIKDIQVSISDILVRHDNRLEKDY